MALLLEFEDEQLREWRKMVAEKRKKQKELDFPVNIRLVFLDPRTPESTET
jgi:hypothetical protein